MATRNRTRQQRARRQNVAGASLIVGSIGLLTGCMIAPAIHNPIMAAAGIAVAGISIIIAVSLTD